MTEWISVKDRLPEDDDEVLMFTEEVETYGRHKEKRKIYRNMYRGYYDGWEWYTSYCYGCERIKDVNEKYPDEHVEITHWMPLPDPPEK